MSDKSRVQRLPPRPLLIIGGLIVLTLALTLALVFATQSSQTQTPQTGVTFQVHIGFDGRYKNGTWVPVYVALSNSGSDFTGTLSIAPPSSLSESEWPSTLYQTSITLPAGAQKQVTLYIPLQSNMTDTAQSVDVQLLDIHGHLVLTQSALAHSLNAQDILVGLLSDLPTNFSALTNVDLSNRAATLIAEPLNASTFPTEAAALDNFDMLILDNFTTSTLSDDQLRTLQAWIQRGGTLIEVGGPSWQRSLTPLPANLLPVTISHTSLLSTHIASFSINGAPLPAAQTPANQSLIAPILISTATLAHAPISTINTVILSAGAVPLLVERQQGKGTLYYLAFDPTLEPLASWDGINTFWQSLLLRTLGDQALTPNTGPPILPANGASSTLIPDLPLVGIGMQDLLYAMLPRSLPLPWPLLATLLGYILVIGPLRLFFTHVTKRRWSWRIVLSSLVVFSCLSYTLALHEKNDATLSNSISILQLNQDGTSAHMTTYTGIFLPDQGSFQVALTGTQLTQALPQTLPNDSSSSSQIHIISNEDRTTINLNGDHTWTMHTLVSEQESSLKGTVIPHLTLDNGAIVGTITNTLPYSLSDSYILMAKIYVHSGPLMAHQTRTIHISLKDTADPLETLADQITSDNGLPSAYNLNTNLLQVHTLADLHLETLTALSGELNSFACGLNICLLNSGKPQQLFGDPVTFSAPGNDPLLIANASATLIGWADQEPDASNSIRVNDTLSTGTHETLLQIPLTIHFPDTTPIPSHTLTARLIDVEGKNVQSQPGIYLITSGSMTFELPLPTSVNVQTQPLSISLLPYPPDGIYQLENTGALTLADARHLHVALYNWQTATWDATTLKQYTLIVNKQAYVGPNQRILFKIMNTSSSQGTFVLGTPIVTL